MELTHTNAGKKLTEEKLKRTGQRAAQAKKPRVHYARDDDDDDDVRGAKSDDDEMDVEAQQEAPREVKTSRGRTSKKRQLEEDATLEEQQQEINADKLSRKRHKLNGLIRQRQMSIQQSSNGTKSLCTPCAETYMDLEYCECYPVK